MYPLDRRRLHRRGRGRVLHRLMSELLTKCASVGEQHAPEGTWVPSTAGLFDQMAESMQLVAEVSQALNHTRAGIRRVGGQARQRLARPRQRARHEDPAGPA
ncbi:hypothetical protein ACRAWF_03060 [Streptomyces sp. L7]